MRIVQVLVEFIRRVETRLPSDVKAALTNLYNHEDGVLPKKMYETIILNINEAERKSIPLCQDTGSLMFFIKAGIKSPFLDMLDKYIIEAVRIATKSIPLRPNAIDPISNRNSGDNTGKYMPWIHWDEIRNTDTLEIGLYVAGGGSSFPGRAQVFSVTKGWENLVSSVVEIIIDRGINACPPLVVGIGIGATMEVAALLSKKALFRKIGQRHYNRKIALIEELLLNKLNELEIGPQGIGGKNGIMDVHIEYGYIHPASFAVGVSTSCWALRRGVLVIDREGNHKVLDYW